MSTPGRPRLLTPALTSGDESVLELLPALRAALNGSGPALRLTGPGISGARPPVPLGENEDDPHDPTAVAVTTSGSTGRPKVVLLPASALLASTAATHDRLGGAGHWLLTLPALHVAGLQVMVRSLVGGTRPVVLDLTDGFTPEKFVEATARLANQRRYTSLVPTQLTRLLQAGAAAQEALRTYDAILLGGAATAPALQEQAAQAGVRLVTTYGMSETSGGCVYDEVPLDGVKVRLEEDRILIGGPTLARGYLGDPAATAAAFTDGWFRTDDGGVLDGPTVKVTGRLDSTIITGGTNVAPALVEATLQRLPEVAEAVVVGLPDPEWGQRVAAVLVLRPGAQPPTLSTVRRVVAEQVSPAAAPRQLLVLDELPLRGPGKPNRAAITDLLAKQSPPEGL